MSYNTEISYDLIRKIKKLMALAAGNANQNEAAAAAEKVQALAAQYQIDITALESVTEGPKGGKREKTTHDRAAMYKYQLALMEALAKLYFCRHFIQEVDAQSFGKARRVKRHVLLGRNTNVQMTVMIYDYLIETMDRLLPYSGMQKRGKEALLWLDGCSATLIERLNDKRRKMEEESAAKAGEAEVAARHPSAAPGTALVLSDVYSSEDDFNTDFEQGLEPGTTARQRAEWEAGRAARKAEYDARILEMSKRMEEARATYRGTIPDHLMANFLMYLVRYNYSYQAAKEGAEEIQKNLEREERASKRPETEKQRADRERREQRYYNESYRRQNNNRAYTPEYQAGRVQGQTIGLDDQVSQTKKGAIR